MWLLFCSGGLPDCSCDLVACLLTLVCSTESRYMNGSIVEITGGRI